MNLSFSNISTIKHWIIKSLFFGLLFSNSLSATTWEWDDGGSTDIWSSYNQAQYKNNWDPNSNPTTISGVTPTVIFGNLVSSNQTITIKHGNKKVHTATFKGPNKYILKGSPDLIFDSGTTGGSAYLNVLNHGSGNSNHIIDVDVRLYDDLVMTQTTTNTFTFKDKIKLYSNEFTIDTIGTVYAEDNIEGSGSITKKGTGIAVLKNNNSYSGGTTIENGILRIQTNDGAGTGDVSVLSGGTFSLDGGIQPANNLYLSGSGYNNLGALQSYSGANKIEGSISLVDNATIRAESGSSLTIESNITGANKDLTLSGPGTITLEQENNFSGTTTISEATVYLDVTDTLKSTTEVIIENGGTLIMKDEHAINNNADMELAGGTFTTGGHNQTLQTLTLSADSTINVGGTDSRVEFSDLIYTDGVILTIDDYAHHEDYIIFSTTVPEKFLENVYWADQGITGAIQLSSGRIIPIIPPPFAAPEPSTYFAGIASILLLGLRYFKKFIAFFS